MGGCKLLKELCVPRHAHGPPMRCDRLLRRPLAERRASTTPAPVPMGLGRDGVARLDVVARGKALDILVHLVEVRCGWSDSWREGRGAARAGQ